MKKTIIITGVGTPNDLAKQLRKVADQLANNGTYADFGKVDLKVDYQPADKNFGGGYIRPACERIKAQ